MKVKGQFIDWDCFYESAPHGSEDWAGSDRGWAKLHHSCHPEKDGLYFDYLAGEFPEGIPCGYYLKYDGKTPFFATAYLFMPYVSGYSSTSLGHAEFATEAEAKTWIENRIYEHLKSRGVALELQGTIF